MRQKQIQISGNSVSSGFQTGMSSKITIQARELLIIIITVNTINGPLRNRVSELRDKVPPSFLSEVSFNKYYAISWYVVSKAPNLLFAQFFQLLEKGERSLGSFLTSRIQKAPSIEEEAEGVIILKYK